MYTIESESPLLQAQLSAPPPRTRTRLAVAIQPALASAARGLQVKGGIPSPKGLQVQVPTLAVEAGPGALQADAPSRAQPDNGLRDVEHPERAGAERCALSHFPPSDLWPVMCTVFLVKPPGQKRSNLSRQTWIRAQKRFDVLPEYPAPQGVRIRGRVRIR